MLVNLRQHWLFIVLTVMLTVFYLWGVILVPFHPDESTQLFMSADFERLFTDPLSMVWAPDEDSTINSSYRLLDAPITRYLLGFGRFLFDLPSLEADWDWSATWDENQQSGALPSERLLLIGRFTVASLYPLTLILLYLIGISFGGRLLGLTTIFIFGTNALIFLHTRRAMAEGALIFTFVLALYALIRADKRPFLAGLAVALAFSTKQTAIILLPIGFLAVCWIPKKDFRRVVTNATFFFTGFILLIYLLNPFLWRQPITASLEAISQRQTFLEQQVNDRDKLAPAQVLHTAGERVAVIMAQLSIAPPMFSEVGNYRINTASEEAIYLGFPGHQLGRGPVSAGILLGFFFLGIIAAIRNSINADFIRRRELFLILLTLLAAFLGIILMVPLPWQRYSLLLIPLFSIFAGIGLTWGIENSRRIISNGSLSDRLAQILSQFASNGWMS